MDHLPIIQKMQRDSQSQFQIIMEKELTTGVYWMKIKIVLDLMA